MYIRNCPSSTSCIPSYSIILVTIGFFLGSFCLPNYRNKRCFTIQLLSIHLNLTLSRIWIVARYPGGGVITTPPPLESVRMKLQRRVRGQIMGSWVCPVHLDYFQMADMCISRVFSWCKIQTMSCIISTSPNIHRCKNRTKFWIIWRITNDVRRWNDKVIFLFFS